jgi:hypothetical protein
MTFSKQKNLLRGRFLGTRNCLDSFYILNLIGGGGGSSSITLLVAAAVSM